MAGVVVTGLRADSTTLASLFDRYALEVSPGKGGVRWERVQPRSLPQAYPLFAGPVATLDAPALTEWRDARLHKVKPSTVNRELDFISAVINHAMREWRWPG